MADRLDHRTQYIVDGTLLPCWSWASHLELYSGKHQTTGMNVQVACTLARDLAWISGAVNGSQHRGLVCVAGPAGPSLSERYLAGKRDKGDKQLTSLV